MKDTPTSLSNCSEEFDGSILRPAVAFRETGVDSHLALGMISFDFWSNFSIEWAPYKVEQSDKYDKT